MGFSSFKKSAQTAKIINKYKAVRDKIVRVKSTITFLIRCRSAGIVPKFISNSTKNVINIFDMERIHKIKHNILTYTDNLHKKMLNLIIQQNHQLLKQFRYEMEMIVYSLEGHLTMKELEEFLSYNDKLAESLDRKVREIHKRKFDKLYNMQQTKLGIKLNEKWFVNKSDADIPPNVQWILSLGQKHALPVEKKNFPLLKIIAEGEDFIQTLKDKEQQEMARSQLTMVIGNHINRIKLTESDRFIVKNVKEADRFLKLNRNIIILNSDKGNTTVAMNKCDYDSRIDDIVKDTTAYIVMNRDPTGKLQRRNNEIVEELFRRENITQQDRKKLKTNIAIAPKLYGVPKIHKESFPLRPICCCVNAPSYELCRYITNILKRLNEDSKYNIRNSLQFKDKIKDVELNFDDRLVSFDVVSLFPSIPVDYALDVIGQKWNKIRQFTNIEKEFFLGIVKFCIEDNRYFQYDNRIYNQIKGLPMGSPASPIVADIIMEELLNYCVGELSFEPKILTKYVDDLFCILPEKEIDRVLLIFNNFHDDIKFTVEVESDLKLSYLDTLVKRENNRLSVDWYQKPTSSGRIINYFSKHPRGVIINTGKNMIERILGISDQKYHRKNKEIIKNILLDNNFPAKLTNTLIRQQENKIQHNNITTEPKIYKSLTYVPEISEKLKRSNIFDRDNYRVTFKSFMTLRKLFSRTKDEVKKLDKSNLVYKIPCGGNSDEICDKVYIGTTKNTLKTRLAGHRSDQKYRAVSSQKTALTSHCARHNHYPKFEDTSVLNSESNYKRRLLLEMLQIVNVPSDKRINFKTDIDSIAQNYRYLVNRDGK